MDICNFIFQGMGVLRAYEALRICVSSVPSLDYPERIYGTTNRMVFCTLIQVGIRYWCISFIVKQEIFANFITRLVISENKIE